MQRQAPTIWSEHAAFAIEAYYVAHGSLNGGCPWRCGYCHNPHLLPARGANQIDWSDVLSFLKSRRGLLDGVVFSGGEPTLQRALPRAMATIRELGFRIGLHTGGAYPELLADVLPWIDWVGFDVKAAFNEYAHITGVSNSGAKAKDSLQRILASGVAYEVRTTVHSALLDDDALSRLHADLRTFGIVPKLQTFRPTGCATEALING